MKRLTQNFRFHSMSVIICSAMIFSLSACEYEVIEPNYIMPPTTEKQGIGEPFDDDAESGNGLIRNDEREK